MNGELWRHFLCMREKGSRQSNFFCEGGLTNCIERSDVNPYQEVIVTMQRRLPIVGGVMEGRSPLTPARGRQVNDLRRPTTEEQLPFLSPEIIHSVLVRTVRGVLRRFPHGVTHGSVFRRVRHMSVLRWTRQLDSALHLRRHLSPYNDHRMDGARLQSSCSQWSSCSEWMSRSA